MTGETRVVQGMTGQVLVVWEPEFPLSAQAEQRQIDRWIADGVALCPFSRTPCDCRGLPPDQRCI